MKRLPIAGTPLHEAIVGQLRDMLDEVFRKQAEVDAFIADFENEYDRVQLEYACERHRRKQAFDATQRRVSESIDGMLEFTQRRGDS